MPPPQKSDSRGWGKFRRRCRQPAPPPTNTLSGKANYVRIGECFLAHADNAAWGKTWTNVPEADICTQDFFGSLATYRLFSR